MDRYTLFGNPVSHSLSPFIHAAFAKQCGEQICYDLTEPPTDGLGPALRHFYQQGGAGANVTLPFKAEAMLLCDALNPRAEAAGAVNTLIRTASGWQGDNSDGPGLVRDLSNRLGWPLANAAILVLGAGGAVSGVLKPLLDQQPAGVVIANRTVAKAQNLAQRFGDPCRAIALTALDSEPPADLIVNAISAGHSGQRLTLPRALIADHTACYDLSYGHAARPFLSWAENGRARAISDGLGMLVEQAAESFFLWRNFEPETDPVLAALRRELP